MYTVLLERRAEKDLDKLVQPIRQACLDAILGLKINPRPTGCKKLKGEIHNWRVRIGDYRILYEINDPSRMVKVYRVKHRKEAYR